MDLSRLSPSDITFTQELSSSDDSARFLVHIEDNPYFLKVHHGQGPRESWQNPNREVNIHTCEVSAYKRLQEHGICNRGVTPKFYGSIDDIDPKLYAPHLDDFLEDEYPPSALLLEYIPNMTPLHFENYSKARADNFLKGINEIQAAGVEHGDVYPRNMMIFEDDPERVMWIDFDRAQTYDMARLTEKQREWLDFENEITVCIMDRMKADSEKGEMDRTLILYA
ncbi:hypothetical protein BJX99DRAFT_236901 [Aspergillus californicus]